ncbi:hypothetical protein F2Q69_00047789 [Brassica cretica]|uniref:Uncharacterized protein n=1 Tax=Brassica cretica TaxID=69181 RepID=A0A8S9PU32_BRACR|nr:hypothetical protein F2Q69_00047789 [Brassica cretica]
MRNFSTCEDVMEQINSKQKLLGKEHISAILPTEPTARRSMKSFHHRSTSVQNHNPLDPYGYAREIVGHVLQVSKEDTADILQMANGVDNLFMQQCTVPTTQKDVQNSAEELLTILEPENSTRKRKMNMESTEMIKDVQEMWMDTSSMCPKRNMLAHSYRPSWYQRSTPRTRSMRCSMESVEPKRSKKEMRQDIAKIQHGTDKHQPASIDRHHPRSIDDGPKNSHPMKSQPDFHTRAEIDQLVEEIYGTLETTEERLDRRLEIQSYIARRLEASTSIDRRNNKSTDILRQKLVDDPTNRGRLVPKVTSDMSDTQPKERRSQLTVGVKIVFRRCESRNVEERISLDEVSIVSEDHLNRGHYAPGLSAPVSYPRLSELTPHYHQLVELALGLVQLPVHSPSSLKLPFTSSWLSLSFLIPLTLSLSHDTLVLRSDDLTEYRAILVEEDKLLHHSSWKRNAPSIDKTVSTSIDTQPHQRNRKRASTDIAYYPSIDTGVDHVREGDYSIGSWADDHHHESYAVETTIHEQ